MEATGRAVVVGWERWRVHWGCTTAGKVATGDVVALGTVREDIEAADARMGEQGLRVLAAARFLEEGESLDDRMAPVHDLTFVGLVGIIDPLRPEAKDAVRTALHAGIEVRMITGDHAVTAAAIGQELGQGRGAISGTQMRALSDEELSAQLPDLHVFGRVSPEDKLRLVQVMQRRATWSR